VPIGSEEKVGRAEGSEKKVGSTDQPARGDLRRLEHESLELKILEMGSHRPVRLLA
jgi:hypothetical protein